MLDATKVAGAFVRNEDGSYSLSDQVEAVHAAMEQFGIPKLHKTGVRMLIDRIRLIEALGTGSAAVTPADVKACMGLADTSIEQVTTNQFVLKQYAFFVAQADEEDAQQEAA